MSRAERDVRGPTRLELANRDDGALHLSLSGADGSRVAEIVLSEDPRHAGLVLDVAAPAPAATMEPGSFEAHLRFACPPEQRFYGLGGQTDAAEHRGETVPVRVTEQGLTKQPDLPESRWSIRGHLHESYFPLPYVLVATPAPAARAHGLVLETDVRSRFLLCSDEQDVLEIQAPLAVEDGVGRVRLRLLAGPTPRDVVRQLTAVHGRQPPLPRWAFGPWVALLGEPLAIVDAARALDTLEIPASVVWDQDWRDHDHPDLGAMAERLHARGLRVLTYFNTFLDTRELADPEGEAIARGFAPERPGGGPYRFLRVLLPSSIADLTDPAAVAWMEDRLARGYARGVDGWMADYGEWVAPDMRFHDGRTGRGYANRYPVDWARLNARATDAARPDGDAVVFMRAGYLGSVPHLRVLWPGDLQTDWGPLDGLPSVVPYGLGVGLAGVSAYGSDIAGYTGTVSPPSTRELYLRWAALGALSPIMRTHRGADETENWNWDRDAETIDAFRRLAALHLGLLPYLEALHAEATASGLPAMRHVVLEEPGWEGAARADDTFFLGPSLFVAPVVKRGASGRVVELPPGAYYRWDGFASGRFEGPGEIDAPAPPGEIPVFLRAGAVVPRLPATVLRVERAPGVPRGRAAVDVEDTLALLDVGAVAARGDPGRATEPFALTDGTTLEVRAARDAAGAVSALRAGATVALPRCAIDETPESADCWEEDAGGRLRAPLLGDGELLFGAAVTDRPTALRVSGAPPARRWIVSLLH